MTPALRMVTLVLRRRGVAMSVVLALFGIASVALTVSEPLLRHVASVRRASAGSGG